MNKPFFGPRSSTPARNASVGSGNLGWPSRNAMNLTGFDQAALIAALQACMPGGCGPNGPMSQQDMQVLAAQMQASQPQRCRRTLLGLTKVAVAGGASATSVTALGGGATGGPFRGLRLIVPSDISPSGDLTALNVGTATQIALSQTGTSAGIPLRVFDQTSQDSGFIDMDWSTPGGGSDISVTVQNKFAAPFPFFEGALEGLQLIP